MYLLRAKHVNRNTGEYTYRRAKEGSLSIGRSICIHPNGLKPYRCFLNQTR